MILFSASTTFIIINHSLWSTYFHGSKLHSSLWNIQTISKIIAVLLGEYCLDVPLIYGERFDDFAARKEQEEKERQALEKAQKNQNKKKEMAQEMLYGHKPAQRRNFLGPLPSNVTNMNQPTVLLPSSQRGPTQLKAPLVRFAYRLYLASSLPLPCHSSNAFSLLHFELINN